MVTIQPNKAFLERMVKLYDRELDPTIFDFFDYMLNDEMDPINIDTHEAFLEHIVTLKSNLTRIHITNANVRAGRMTTTLDASKFKMQQNEIALLVHTYLPIIRLKLTNDAKTSDLAVFNYFGNNAGTYQFDTSLIDDLIYILQPNVSISALKSYRNAIASLAEHKTEDKNKNLIVVGNGIYNKHSRELVPFDPSYITTTKIATNYNPDAQLVTIHNDDDNTDWDVESWLKDLAGNLSDNFDNDTYQLFWQIIAGVINPDQVNAKAVFFYSSVGNNGKGTYGQLLKNLVGQDNYSSLPIPAFKHEYLKEKLLGKTLNIADENPVDVYVDDVQDFKAMITGDDIMINRKHEKPIVARIKAINIQMLNGLPKTRDKSNSIYRRLLIVPFTHTFTGIERPYIKRNYMNRTDVKEYILKRALEAPIVTEFIVTKENEEALYRTKVENNSVFEFFDEFLPRFKWDVLPTKFLYDLYVSWMAKDNANGKPVKKSAFVEYTTDYLDETNEWNARVTQKEIIKVGARMDADEPLITEYNLTDYMDPNYKGTNLQTKRAFSRPKTTRGYARRKNATA